MKNVHNPLSKAVSTNDFTTALAQPVTVQNTVESLIPVVDPAAIVEPVIPYFGAPLADPLIPYDPRIIKPLVPYA